MLRLGIAFSANVLWAGLQRRLARRAVDGFSSADIGPQKVMGLTRQFSLSRPIDDFWTIRGIWSGVRDAPKRTGPFMLAAWRIQISSALPLVLFRMCCRSIFDADKPILPQFGIMLATVTWFRVAGSCGLRGLLPVGLRAKLQAAAPHENFNALIGMVMIASGGWRSSP